MPYFWIFLSCYALAFILINMKMAAQTAHMKAHLREFGASEENFGTTFRQSMPLAKEILIRFWAPLVFSVVPTGLLSIGYFLFS